MGAIRRYFLIIVYTTEPLHVYEHNGTQAMCLRLN